MPIGVLSVVVSFWVMGGAVELMSTTFASFSVGRTGHFIGTALAPIVAFVTFREYTGVATPTRMIVMLLIIPVMSVTIAATNQYHEFMWYLPATNELGEFLTRPNEWGPWFLFLHAPYSYAVVGIAMLTLLVHSSAVAPAHRRGLFLTVAACVVPLTASVDDEELDRRALRCIFANAAAGRFLSVNPDDLVNQEAEQIVRLSTTGMDPNDAERVVDRFLDVTESGHRIDIEVRQCRSGTGRWLRMICEPVGDDFALTLVDVTDGKAKERQMESIARSDPLTAALEEPYMIGSETLQCAASIGLALYPENARTLTGLLREADQAMYRAKARSRDEADTGGTGLLEKAI